MFSNVISKVIVLVLPCETALRGQDDAPVPGAAQVRGVSECSGYQLARRLAIETEKGKVADPLAVKRSAGAVRGVTCKVSKLGPKGI